MQEVLYKELNTDMVQSVKNLRKIITKNENEIVHLKSENLEFRSQLNRLCYTVNKMISDQCNAIQQITEILEYPIFLLKKTTKTSSQVPNENLVKNAEQFAVNHRTEGSDNNSAVTGHMSKAVENTIPESTENKNDKAVNQIQIIKKASVKKITRKLQNKANFDEESILPGENSGNGILNENCENQNDRPPKISRRQSRIFSTNSSVSEGNDAIYSEDDINDQERILTPINETDDLDENEQLLMSVHSSFFRLSRHSNNSLNNSLETSMEDKYKSNMKDLQISKTLRGNRGEVELNQNRRQQRKVAPTSLKEPSLKKKLRQN